MNIYLDIDGVLLANEAHAAVGTDVFLQAVLNKYPDAVYWLTTHCWRGENRCIEILEPVLRPETVAPLHKIKPTEWGELKTDAIDFSQPFLWLDDDLLPEEAEILKQHNAINNYIRIDLQTEPEQLLFLAKKFFQ